MKTLGILLLLAAVLGGAWWTFTHPGATAAEARAEAGAALERGRAAALAARDAALEALNPAEGTVAADAAPAAAVNELRTLVERMERRLAELETGAPDPIAANATAPDSSAELERRVDTLAARVDALDATLGELAAREERALREIVREELAALAAADATATSPDAPPDAEIAPDARAALQAEIATLAERLDAVGGDEDPAVARSLDEVREQVDALARRGFVTREELREQTAGRHVEYKVYFDAGSTEIGAPAARLLDVFIEQEAERTTGVSIYGFTDRAGSASFNRQLAVERAVNVRAYLLQNGLPFDRIGALSGLGEEAAAALLPDESADAQQRVVVLFAAQP